MPSFQPQGARDWAFRVLSIASSLSLRFVASHCKYSLSINRSCSLSATQDFILRARVLKLYQQALRTARRAPGDTRAELGQIIRQEMEDNRNADRQRIRFLISEGLERLKRLDEMLDMQGHSQ